MIVKQDCPHCGTATMRQTPDEFIQVKRSLPDNPSQQDIESVAAEVKHDLALTMLDAIPERTIVGTRWIMEQIGDEIIGSVTIAEAVGLR